MKFSIGKIAYKPVLIKDTECISISDSHLRYLDGPFLTKL